MAPYMRPLYDALKKAFHGSDLSLKPAVLVDFTSVPYVDSSGIAALMGTVVAMVVMYETF